MGKLYAKDVLPGTVMSRNEQCHRQKTGYFADKAKKLNFTRLRYEIFKIEIKKLITFQKSENNCIELKCTKIMINSMGLIIEDEISTGESPAPGTYCGNGRVSIY